MEKFAKRMAVIGLITYSTGCGGGPDAAKKDAAAVALPAGRAEGVDHGARTDVSFQIREPWGRGRAVRVRLDPERLRAYGLSKEDVMRALTPSGLVDPKEPPPGVVFDTHLRPDRYENCILKADADGDIVRLKDVAEVELLAAGEGQEAEPDAVLPASK